MKKIIILFSSMFLFASTNDFQKAFSEYIKTTNKQYINYKKEMNQGFIQYKNALDKGFKLYKKELSKYWKNPELSTKTTFVEYSKDKKIRKKVDYKNNYIQIDVIAKDNIIAKKEIAKSLYSLAKEDTKTAFNNNPVLYIVNKELKNKYVNMVKATPPSNEPIVADMIFKTPPTQKEMIDYTLNKVKTNKIAVSKSKIPNMNVYSIKIPLPSKAYLQKAKIYKKEVFQKSKQFKIKPQFIYAIIHTESAFNPMARSYIPAFGLMQIVPNSAGVDAYQMLTGKRKILSPSYLYNANNNILIGSAYIYKVYYIYLKNIKNPMSRLYCTIAAYNTGVGNVACAFNSTKKDYSGKTICSRIRGDYDIIKASKKINKMSSNQVYNYLLKNLRYDEAKNYLKKVSQRFYIYKKAIDSNAI